MNTDKRYIHYEQDLKLLGVQGKITPSRRYKLLKTSINIIKNRKPDYLVEAAIITLSNHFTFLNARDKNLMVFYTYKMLQNYPFHKEIATKLWEDGKRFINSRLPEALIFQIH